MSKQETYLEALDRQGLFEDSAHRTRFKELLDCYSQYPFFNRGLCKCMYLSAWDEEHFAIILGVLTDLALGRERDTEEMRIQGEAMAEEHMGGEYYVYQLSNAFLDNREFELEEGVELSEEFEHIITQALKAEKAIDQVSL
ncbi:MAG: hypothetical protein HFG78_03735 [Hungatella sp.]|jgi:hypothetical protein|nr:hypothetical protein [Hungatella sp.]MCI9501970.1 hypothetical protein [Hungatella sp.]MCI9637790.1 hypothetical protein [Hungatella sp.]